MSHTLIKSHERTDYNEKFPLSSDSTNETELKWAIWILTCDKDLKREKLQWANSNSDVYWDTWTVSVTNFLGKLIYPPPYINISEKSPFEITIWPPAKNFVSFTLASFWIFYLGSKSCHSYYNRFKTCNKISHKPLSVNKTHLSLIFCSPCMKLASKFLIFVSKEISWKSIIRVNFTEKRLKTLWKNISMGVKSMLENVWSRSKIN